MFAPYIHLAIACAARTATVIAESQRQTPLRPVFRSCRRSSLPRVRRAAILVCKLHWRGVRAHFGVCVCFFFIKVTHFLRESNSIFQRRACGDGQHARRRNHGHKLSAILSCVRVMRETRQAAACLFSIGRLTRAIFYWTPALCGL